MIPCKRPKVTIEAHEKTFKRYDGDDATGTYHLVTCHVPGCTFTYDAAVVSDAQQQASWHRAHHRAAVPKTHIAGSAGHGFHASCFDPAGWHHWGTSPGCTTRTDVEASLDSHLRAEHGLVTCS